MPRKTTIKKNNDSTSDKKIPKRPTSSRTLKYYGEYYSVITGKFEIINDEKIQDTTRKLIEVSQNCTGTETVTGVIRSLKIPINTYEGWLEKFPYLKEAERELKEAIGDQRERRGLENDMNVHFVTKSMPLYSKRWKDLDEWRTSINAKATAAATNEKLVVQMTAAANSPLVPRKDEEDDEFKQDVSRDDNKA